MSDLVPDGWDKMSLSNLVEVRSSNVDKKSYDDETPVKLCNYTDVYYKNIINGRIDFMNATAKQREIERFTLELDDVIITKDSETPDDIAVPAYVAESMDNVLCGYHLTLLRPNKAKTSGQYLSHAFQLPTIQHHFYVLANGITRFGLTADAINNAPFIVPPLPEQQKIAKVLTSVDEVIEKTQAQIDKLKDLKTGMMQELLTNGIGHNGKPHTKFKDSPVGRIPAAWDVVQVKDIATVKGGKRMPKGRPFSEKKTKHPYIRVVNFENGTVNTDDLKYVLPEDQEKIKRYVIEKDDLYISIAGTIGSVGSVPWVLDGAQLTENAAKITLSDFTRFDKDYIKYVLSSFVAQNQFHQEMGTGGGVPKLALFRIESTLLPVPSFREQQKISRMLFVIDSKIEVLKNKSVLVKNTKKALMQALLTGKVRVNVESTS